MYFSQNYAQEMLKKKETINNLVSRVVEVKLENEIMNRLFQKKQKQTISKERK